MFKLGWLQIYSIVILFFTLSVISLTVPINLHAETILLQENFDDGNVNDGTPADWEETPGNGTWLVDQGKYIGTMASGTTGPLSLVGDNTWANYSVEVEMTGLLGVDRHILVRYDPTRPLPGYAVKYREQNLGFSGHVELQKAGVSVLASNEDFNAHTGETHVLRVEAKNNNIKIFTDNTLMIDYTDNNNPIYNGRVGFFVERSGIGVTNSTAYDNLIIKSIPEILLNVPDFKQGQVPWGDDNYDHINNTLAEVGCTLSTAAMIMRYHNHDVDPGTLNELLKNTRGGYNREGSVIWPTVAKLTSQTTALNAALPKKKLEWVRISGATRDDIKNQITLNRPMSIRVPGHSVVGIGYEDNEILINDPWQTPKLNLTNLETSRGAMQRIETFSPSETDFSYIYLVVDQNMGLKVFDPNGNELPGYSFLEDPNANDLGNPSSGMTLRVFAFPKPVDGNYEFSVLGTGSYKLDSYLFDDEGEVNFSSFNGIVGGVNTDTYSAVIGSSNQTVSQITIDSTIADVDAAYSQHLIKNEKVYKLIKGELLVAKYFLSRGRTILYRGSLKIALNHIKKSTPKYITSEASNILQGDIKYLLNN